MVCYFMTVEPKLIRLEFIAMMTGRTRAPPEPVCEKEIDGEAEFKSAWREFDPSLKSSITASQFRQLMAGMGEKVTDTEVDEIINSVDGEDKITCEFTF
jgi:calmodulin